MRAGDEVTVQSHRVRRGNSEPTDTSLVRKKSPMRLTSPRSSDFIDEESQNGIFLDALYQAEPKFMLDLEGQKPKLSPNTDSSQHIRNPFRPNTMSKFVFKSLKVQHTNEEDNYPSSGNLQLLNLKDYRTKSSMDPSEFNPFPPTKGSSQDEIELRNEQTFDDLKSDMKRQDRKSISSNEEEKVHETEPPTKEKWTTTIAQFFTQRSRRGSSMFKDKDDFKLSQRQHGIINDKADVLNKDIKMVGLKKRLSQRKKGQPRFKQLLQKHKIVKANLQTDFVKRIIARINRRKRGFWFSIYDSVKKGCKKVFEQVSNVKQSILSLAIPVSPLGNFKTCWDFIAIVLTVYEMVFIPFQIGFEYDPTGSLAYFELIKDFFFIFDILLMFHTAPLHENNDNTDVFVRHRKIAKIYLKGYFAFDLAASLPYRELVNQQFGDDANSSRLFMSQKLARFILLLRVLRIVRISTIFARLKDKMHSQVVTGIISLVNLFVNVIFLAHIVACTWHFVGMEVEREIARSWISTFGFLDESIAERYIASLYWAILTMITVGYGDITAVTMPERIVNICVMLLGCGVFGYSMNSIGILLQNINAGVSKKRYGKGKN